jgi:hypothetical protein
MMITRHASIPAPHIQFNSATRWVWGGGLTQQRVRLNMRSMAQSFLIFDFGDNESAAQQARHRIEGWKQAFRLDKKIQLKFDRKETAAVSEVPSEGPPAAGKGSAKAKGGSKAKPNGAEQPEEKPPSSPAATAEIDLIVRLDFSDHEKLSHHRWLDRIPSEEPFKTAKPRVVRSGDADFSAVQERFDSLD